MAKYPIPTINPTHYTYSAAKKELIFSNYVSTWKGKDGVDFLNTTHSHSNVINKLNARTTFSSSDINDLEVFTANVDNIAHCNNFINNFKQSSLLDLPTLFTKIANSSSYDDFLKSPTITFTSNQQKALPYLFSIIKHCQDPNSYPVNYKQWVNLNEHCKWSTSGNNDYDRLCELYKSIRIPTTDVPKHLYFAAYMEYLAYQLMIVIAPTINNYSKTALYKLFNTYKKKIDDLLAGNGSPQNPLVSGSKSISPHQPLNLILYGPPGTGKTYNTLFHALAIIKGKDVAQLHKEVETGVITYKNMKQDYDRYIDSKQIVFTTFHQSMSYEDFIEGIKPKVSNSKKQMTYEVQDGVFKQICNKAEKEQTANYVLIIDEINRGNVAQIFGELITLIEPNKRLGKSEEMKAILPYSSAQNGESVYFGVPQNLYIIGTMNTADRSVEALDTALRRRFSFEEMMPKPELLKDDNQKPLEVCDVKLCDLLTTINARIVALKDREHQIGHSYFMGCPDEANEAKVWLKNIFKDKIIPLLQEYFYGDYKKIYYVLGEEFVRKVTENNSDIFSVEIDDDFDLDENMARYEIKSFDENAEIDNKIDIVKAVKSLTKSVTVKKKEKRREQLKEKGYKDEDIEKILNGEPESNFKPEETKD